MDKTIIVVEGKHDKNKIISAFPNASVMITNGSAVDDSFLLTLELLSKTNKIILCLDPDGPGNIIRSRIIERIPSCDNVYALKNNAISKNHKKIGIEHMTIDDIKEMFKNVYHPALNNKIEYIDLCRLGLMDNKEARRKLCGNLHMEYCNAKQLLKRLNMLDIDLEEVKRLL